jgi:CheY-like chemotaxis protein
MLAIQLDCYGANCQRGSFAQDLVPCMPALDKREDIGVLIVEDELIGAAHIKAVIEDIGFRVIGIASTVEAAHDFIASGKKIDCATLDVRLQENLSSSIAGALLANGIPFVICSAYNISLPDFPRVPVLQKPFAAADLEAALRRAMESSN